MSRFATRSHPGRVYDQNEDSVGVLPEQGFYLVADGMGGHASGEIASRIATDTLLEAGVRMPLADALVAADRAVSESAAADPSRRGMGSTAVAMRIEHGVARLAWVGDSRGYLFRKGALRRLTRDHSLINLLLDRDEVSAAEAQHHPQRHIVTQTLGHGEPVPSTVAIQIRAGDRLLLCSDGLHDELRDDEIAGVLRQMVDVEAAAQQLIDQALARGGRDNISVVLVECTRDDARPDRSQARPAGRQARPKARIEARWLPAIAGVGAAALLAAVWWLLRMTGFI